MGKFYVTWVNISLDSRYLDKFCLFSTDVCNVSCEVLGMHSGKQNLQYTGNTEELKNSSVECDTIISGKGIIKDSCNKMFTLKNSEKSYTVSQSSLGLTVHKKLSICMDGYAVSLFLFCLKVSQKYVDIVTKHMSYKWSTMCKQHSNNFQLSKLQIELKQPQGHVMDLMWAQMACNTFHELRQLQYAMSWLSTLGGAFSALGEGQERCAKAAGAISIKQLRIALKLGDNIVITQCKLYYSLSLIQRGYCKLAKRIILEQYTNSKNSPVVDRKTLNMCKGIWARLKYELQKRRRQKRV